MQTKGRVDVSLLSREAQVLSAVAGLHRRGGMGLPLVDKTGSNLDFIWLGKKGSCFHC